VLASDAHLFPARPAYRFRPITAPSQPYDDPTIGENPPYGALINYYLKAPPSGNVTVTILDQKARSFGRSPARRPQPQPHQLDLRYEPTSEVRLRTSPMYAPHVRVGPDGWRPAPGAGTLTVLAPPGKYTVKLSAGGRELTESLTVLKDPHSGGTEADIAAQMQLLFALRGDVESAAQAVNRMELVRGQIEALGRVVEDGAIQKAGEELNQKIIDLEMNLVDLRQTGTGQDGIRFGAKLISKLNYLANGLAGADFKPTDQQLEVQKGLEQQLRSHLAALDGLMSRDVGALNDLLRKRNIPNIVTGAR